MRLDGTLLGLSPFEAEIHRRIWWQLKMHDFRAAELAGQAKLRSFDLDETTPKQPANVNDSDLYPGMPQAPAESTRPTEMIWVKFKWDIASFAATQEVQMRKLGKAVFTSEEYPAMDDLQIKDGFIKRFEDMIETKYLRFCDPSQPLQLMTLLGGRTATNLVRFLAHHPRRWANLDQVSASEQQLVWSIVLQLLEQYNMKQSSLQLRRFAWSVPYFIQWHAVIHVLDTLRADPLHRDAVKAWRFIDSMYTNNSEMLLSTNRPIFVAVGNLCLKAFSARATALSEENRNLSEPPYIPKLREQRRAAKAKREATIARSKGQVAVDRGEGPTTTDADAKGPDTTPRPAGAVAGAQPQQYPAVKQPAYPVQRSIRTGDDAFWLSDALDADPSAGGAADMMNLDADAILAQDYWLGPVIDWAQWDAWVGNLRHPNIGAHSA